MVTQYPGKIDNNISLPDAVDNITPVKAEVINRLKQAILAIQNELGTKPSGIYSTLKARLSNVESIISNLEIIELNQDLGGTLSAPQVIGIRGTPISDTVPASGEALIFNGLVWEPAPVVIEGFVTVADDIGRSGSTNIDRVLGIKGIALESGDTLAEGETWVKGSGTTLRATAVNGSGKHIQAMADANQTLTSEQSVKSLIKTTGILTAKRKLFIPAPATEDKDYQRTIFNACTGNSILVSVGTGNEVEVEPGAKIIIEASPTGVLVIADFVLDPRDFGCPWNGVDDDLPGLVVLMNTIPDSRQKPTVIQFPKGQGYCSDNWHVHKCVHIYGHGTAQISPTLEQNGLRFAPMKGIIFDGPYTSSTYPLSSADKSRMHDVTLFSTQCVVTDAGGNIGRTNYFLDTTLDIWSGLPATVILGTVVLRSGATVGSIQDYYNDGATRDLTHVVMFRCTTSGTKGSGEPAAFATAGIAELGDTITATAGTAVWTVESIPKDYLNDTVYVAGQRVIVPGESDHVFECLEGGTSCGWTTAINVLSDGVDLVSVPGTINVDDASDFPDVGTIRISSTNGPQDVAYTGKTATTFTGCTGGTGLLATGQLVRQGLNWANWGAGVRIPEVMMAPSYAAIFHDRFTQIAVGSNGETLAALPSTVFVDNTDDFPETGDFKVFIGGVYKTISYTGKTAATFTGCTTVDTGTLATGQEVGAGIKWQWIPSQLVTMLANHVEVHLCALLGATGCAVWIQSNGDYSVTQGQLTTGGSVGCRVHDTMIQQCASGEVLNSFNADSGSHVRNFFDFIGGGRTNVDEEAYLNISATPRWGNGGGCIKDRCQGNNTFLSLHGSTSGGIPYRNDLLQFNGGSSSTFVHCYDEITLPSLIHSAALVISMLGGLSDYSTVTDLNGALCSTIRTSSKWASDSTKSVAVTLGQRTGTASAVSYLNFRVVADSYAIGWGISNDLTNFPTGWYVFGKAEGTGDFTSQGMMFPRPSVTTTWPSSAAALTCPFPTWITQDDLWIGQGISPYNGDPRSIGFTALDVGIPPASGYYVQGAMKFNAIASIGGGRPIGWQCITSGDPPTWAPIVSAKVYNARGVVNANVPDLSAFVVSQDGVTYVEGDVTLLANQTTGAECGLYVVGVVSGTAPLTRAAVMPSGMPYTNGCTVEVSEGTLFAGGTWKSMATGAKIVGTHDPLFYPRICQGILTLASGTYTLGSAEGLYLWNTTRAIHCTMNTPGGVTTLTVGGYGANSATRTAGKSGTAAATVIARVAAGTIDTANNSTVDWSVYNW